MTNKETAIIKKAYTCGYPVVNIYELLHSQILNLATRTVGFNEFYHTASLASPKTSFIPALFKTAPDNFWTVKTLTGSISRKMKFACQPIPIPYHAFDSQRPFGGK